MNHLSLSQLKGVGPKRTQLLEEAGIKNLYDLVYFFPRRYIEVESEASEWVEGATIESSGLIRQVQHYSPRRGMNIIKVAIEAQGNGNKVSLFWFNQPYLRSKFQAGQEIHFRGKLSKKNNQWTISHPKIISEIIEISSDSNHLIPVYPLTQLLSEHWFHQLIDQALSLYEWPDCLPKSFLSKNHLIDRQNALKEIHYPTSADLLNQARYRFAYEELLFLQVFFLQKRYQNNRLKNLGIKHSSALPNGLINHLEKTLPYKLTSGQKKAWKEIQLDMEDASPMQRLLQGDVGSGKTIIAAFSLAKTVESGFQGALMVPTEILANQHFDTFKKLFPKEIQVNLLTQSIPEKEKKKILLDLKEGRTNILIGTHALIQEAVSFHSLGLVITDEQHRFGVGQRSALHAKGNHPDLLVMTATPIPRTLALTFYGDLEISTIDTLPLGRKPIRTFVRGNKSRKKVYQFAYDQIKEGRQAYVVVPSIEENPDFILQSVEKIYEELKNLWGNKVRVGFLHGKLSGAEKKETMESFVQGKIDLLVSTTVIEVGIHVENATVMIVEDADRFGLSQLHQLRGRIGRGIFSSYCILLSSAPDNDRLLAMEKISDGFLLAEEDLRLRGPGEFFGERQHGIPDLKILDFLSDSRLLKETKEQAFEILNTPKEWQVFIEEMKSRFSEQLKGEKQH